MTTKDLRNNIEKVLGNSIRCLLPSYWWKRLFHQVVDTIDEVVDTIEDINDISIVDSESKLSKLDVPNGSVASVYNERKFKFSECYKPTAEDAKLPNDEFLAKLTRVKAIGVNYPLPETLEKDVYYTLSDYIGKNEQGGINWGMCFIGYLRDFGWCAYGYYNYEALATIFWLNIPSEVARFNEYLSQRNLRYAFDDENLTDEDYSILESIFSVIEANTDVYVKGTAWEKLANTEELDTKQDILVSGTNIKTINGESILGSGDLTIEVGSNITVDTSLSTTSTNPVQNRVVTNEMKKIARTFRITEDSGFLEYMAALGNSGFSGIESNSAIRAFVGKDQADAYVDTVVVVSDSEMGIEFNIRDKRYRWVFNLTSGAFVKEEEISATVDTALSALSTNPVQNKVITSALDDKVDKVSGKQLSTEDFTTTLKTKLESLSNYDDTQLESSINTLRSDFDKLVSGDTTTAIKTFNEVIAFLDGISDTQDLEGIIASIQQQIAGKQDTLVSGTNIKTINGDSILGSGNIVLGASTEIYVGSDVPTDENITVWIDPDASIGDVDWDGITVDEELSQYSTNPIQNKTVYALAARLDGIEAILDNING